MRQVLLQNATVTLLQNAIVLLQNRTAFAKLDVTYKMRSCSIRGVLTGIFFITTKPY